MTVSGRIKVSAPGRICLFGEHQDFLGLPVIACAIDLSIAIAGTPRSDSIFHLDMPDINEGDEFDGVGYLDYAHERDYLRAAVNVLQRKGLITDRGYNCTIRGTIPINSGTGGSSALVVAWIAFLLATQEHTLPAQPQDIAAYAHEAEVVEFGEPGGMMDHYTAALGGLLYMQFGAQPLIEPLPARVEGLVLGDSLVPKETTETLRESREAAGIGFDLLAGEIAEFSVQTTALEQVEPFIAEMPPEISRRVRAQFVNRDLCREACQMLQARRFDEVRLGKLLLEHQQQLREGVGVSHPKLDSLIDASVGAGALGGKLNGSGCGGAMFAYAPGHREQVKAAIDAAGGQGHMTAVRGGVTVEIE